MPTYLTPGVYVEEIPAAQKPLEGVSTSVAAFIGLAPHGTEMVRLAIAASRELEAPLPESLSNIFWRAATRAWSRGSPS